MNNKAEMGAAARDRHGCHLAARSSGSRAAAPPPTNTNKPLTILTGSSGAAETNKAAGCLGCLG
jgi:hypothetical protein